MKERKTFKNNFISPLTDKNKTMRVNHFLSNRYTLTVMVIFIDAAILCLYSAAFHFIRNAPLLLRDITRANEFFGMKSFIPELSMFSAAGILVFLIVVAVIDAIFVYKMKIAFSEEGLNVGQKGVQRFAEAEEIVRQYKEVEELETRYAGAPGILVSRIGHKFYIDDSVVNNLFLGITRSGKGEMFVKTSIELYSRATEQPSLIINDPKLEHYKVFKEKLENRGYLVYLLNGSNPTLSMGFNPLSVCIMFYRKRDYDTAEMVANSLSYSYFNVDKATGDMHFFTSAASDLCTAMILASIDDAFRADKEENQARYEQWKQMEPEEKEAHPFKYRNDNEKTINFYSMIINFGNMATMPINDSGTRTMLDTYFENRPGYDRARLKYLSVEVAPGKTKSGIFSEMLRELSIFTMHNVARMTAESSLDLMELGFGDRPIAVFMATPSYDKSLYKLPTIFIRQAYYVLGKACDEGAGRCKRLVKFILDETGNMPAIEILDTMTTMGLGQNISFDFYLQNYEQMTDIYGEQTAETIKGNCGNHIFIQTKSRKTAEEFSKLLGNRSIVDVHRNGRMFELNKSYMELVQDEPLLDANKLLGLQEGECVIHRTMKRRDNKGMKITPFPIFNSLKNGRYLNYAYEFFGKEYAHPNEINFLDVCSESREHIEPRERLWDLNKSFRMQAQRQMELEVFRDVENSEKIDAMLKKILGTNYKISSGLSDTTTVVEIIDFINKNEKITETEKKAIMMLL